MKQAKDLWNVLFVLQGKELTLSVNNSIAKKANLVQHTIIGMENATKTGC